MNPLERKGGESSVEQGGMEDGSLVPRVLSISSTCESRHGAAQEAEDALKAP